MERNPFFMRTVESLDSDAAFVTLFGADVLELLPTSGLWNKPIFIRSAPGSGKTSLLRLFTPGALQELLRAGSTPERADLFRRLTQLGVIQDNRPTVLGVRIPIRKTDYVEIEKLDTLSDLQREHLFLALLDSRILLIFLRNCLAFADREYPEDVGLVELRARNSTDLVSQAASRIGTSGAGIYANASKTENEICDAIGSLDTPDLRSLPTHQRLWSLHLLSNTDVFVNGEALGLRPLIMFDDAHELHPRQRHRLVDELLDRTLGIPRWLALWLSERYEALSLDEMLDNGSRKGRDYEWVSLDSYKDSKASFNRLLVSVGVKRIGASDARTDVGQAFAAFLKDQGGPLSRDVLTEQDRDWARKRVSDLIMQHPQFSAWLDAADETDGSPHQKAVLYRKLEIQVRRGANRPRLFPESEADVGEPRSSSSLEQAAELMICKERRRPYYYGIDKVKLLSSGNIEQFLGIAGSLLEKMDVHAIIRGKAILNPPQQQEIVVRLAMEKLQSLPREVKHGADVVSLLKAFGSAARDITYRPTAPYEPGVTGFAIPMEDYGILKNRESRGRIADFDRVYAVLESAIANNVLEATPNYLCKGRVWLVLYLNRLLCVPFDLPLGLGGFRETSAKDLAEVLSGRRVAQTIWS